MNSFVIAAVILALLLCLALFIISRKKTPEKSPVSASQSPVAEASRQSDDELIAVLTAALYSYCGAETASRLKIRNYRRIPLASPVWNASGRKEQLAGKL